MVKLLVGGLGTGKTQRLVGLANNLSQESNGHVVFIDDDNRHMYDVSNSVRFINIKEYPIENVDACLGFLCGIISNDYDIDNILVDGLYKVLGVELEDISIVIPKLEKLSELFELDFYLTVSTNDLPEELSDYKYE